MITKEGLTQNTEPNFWNLRDNRYAATRQPFLLACLGKAVKDVRPLLLGVDARHPEIWCKAANRVSTNLENLTLSGNLRASRTVRIIVREIVKKLVTENMRKARLQRSGRVWCAVTWMAFAPSESCPGASLLCGVSHYPIHWIKREQPE